MSLKNRLILLFFTLFLVMGIIISAFSIAALRKEMATEMGEARLEILKQVGDRMRIVVSNMQAVSNLYYNDYRIKELVANRKVLTYSDITYLYSLDVNYSYAFKSIGIDYYAAIVSKNGVGYYSQTSGANPELFAMKDPRNTEWYDRVVDSGGDIVWISSFNLSEDEKDPKYTYSATRALFDSDTREYNGMIMVNIDERQLYEMYTDLLNKDNVIYAIDQNGVIVTHPDQAMLGGRVEEGSLPVFEDGRHYTMEHDKLISKYDDPYTKWTIIEEIPIDSVFSSINRVELMMIIILGVCVSVALLIVVWFARRTVRPLMDLCSNIEQVGDGSMEPISQEYGWSEIRHINKVFNRMLGTLGKLMDDIKKHEGEKRRSDMEYLQAQINPHFIYNTLFSIKCMGDGKDRTDRAYAGRVYSVPEKQAGFKERVHRCGAGDGGYTQVPQHTEAEVLQRAGRDDIRGAGGVGVQAAAHDSAAAGGKRGVPRY